MNATAPASSATHAAPRRLRRLAAVAAAFALAATAASVPGAQAQTLPGPPTVRQVTEDSGSLTVFWAAPGGADVVAYDLRWIAAAATDRADGEWTPVDNFWTSDGLSGEVTGLDNGTEYDLQIRAVTSAGDGPWSAEASGTPRVPAPTVTALVPGDRAMTVAWSAPELAPNTTVDFDVRWIRSDAADKSDARWTLVSDVGATPAHHLIRGLANGTGYDVQVRAVIDHDGAWSATQRAEPYEPAGSPVSTQAAIEIGVPVAAELASSGDTDVFKLVLNRNADLLFSTSGDVEDTVCDLFDRDGVYITGNDDSGFDPDRYHCMFLAPHNAGTFYVKVFSYNSCCAGSYVLHVEEHAEEPGNTIAEASVPEAVEIELDQVRVGVQESEHSADYLRLVVEEEQFVLVQSRHHRRGGKLSLRDMDDEQVRASRNTIIKCILVVFCFGAGFRLAAKLPPGTYYVKVESTYGPHGHSAGPYFVKRLIDTRYKARLDFCEALRTPDDFTDPLSGCQWHLDNRGQRGGRAGEDANVADAHAAGHLGEDVRVAVVDSGIDLDHEDLVANTDPGRSHSYCVPYDDDNELIYDDVDDDADDAFFFDNDHGTSVAGVLAARDNGLGMRGVAPRALLDNRRLIACASETTVADLADAMTLDMADVAVNTNSWGAGNSAAPKAVSALWDAAVETGIESGYGGKGTVYVWAGSNGDDFGDDVNLQEYTSHYAIIAVCAVNATGVRSLYSERGASLWVCAPSGDDGRQLPGLATTTNYDRYRTDHTGTSAATPTVAGVVALVRGANPDLTWRDVKLILAASARRNHADDSGWQQGAQKYGSSTDRYWFNRAYGFGVVDAHAAVLLAEEWQNVPPLITRTEPSTRRLNVPDDRSTVLGSVRFDDTVEFVEHVEIDTHFNAPSFRDLRVELVSPSGTTSLLVPEYDERDISLTEQYTLGSSKHLGEPAEGKWTLRVSDRFAGGGESSVRWSVTLRGHRLRPSAPKLDTITAAATSLTLEWSEPDHEGASAVTGYDVRYIASDATDRGDSQWTVVTDAWGSDTAEPLTYELDNLESRQWDVQVRAKNSGGAGPWSATAQGTTQETPDPNIEPAFATDTAERAVAENTGMGETIGIPVTATDTDAGATLTYQLSGTDQSHFAIGASSGQLLTESPLDHEDRPSYSVSVGVSDGLDSSDSPDDSVDDWIEVDITVTDVDEKFTLTCVGDSEAGGNWTFAEPPSQGEDGSDKQVPVDPLTPDPPESSQLRVGACRVSDPEGEPAQWSLSETDSDAFEISEDGTLLFKEAPDFEQPGDTGPNPNNVYELRVAAVAGGHSDETALTIEVTDLDEPPTLSGPAAITRREGDGGELGRYRATDPENGDVTLSLSGDDAADFQLTGGALSFREAIDYESPGDTGGDNVYELTVDATDGTTTAALDVTVAVEDVDELPTLEDRNCTFTVRENSDSVWRCTFDASDPEERPIRWSLSGPDDDSFHLSNFRLSNDKSSAVLESRSSVGFDYETQQVYSVTVEITEGQNPVVREVTLDVVNVDEPGSVTVPGGLVALVGSRLEAELSDPDGTSNEGWQWQRLLGSWQDIAGETLPAYTPTDADEGLRLRVKVSYSDGFDPRELTSAATATVAPRPMHNNPPEFTEPSITCEVREDRTAGDVDDCRAAATDDDDDPLSYRLDGGAPFVVDSSTGRISVDGPLDHETQHQHFFYVVVSDGLSEDHAAVTVTVTDVDEPGSVSVHFEGALRVDETLNASLADEDCQRAVGCGAQWEWHRSDDGRTWDIITVSASESYRLADDDACHQVRVRAVYTDTHGAQEVLGLPGTADELVQPKTGQCRTAGPNPNGGVPGPSGDVPGPSGGGREDEQPEPADFEDVDPESVHATNIDTLFAADITTGCSRQPLRYCPDDFVTRAQIATLLARALNLDAPQQPAGFEDVDPESVHATNIDTLFAADITTGCSRQPLRYCPDDFVTRAQIATLLARALNLDAPQQPAGFEDVDPESVHATNIDTLFAADITTGCSRQPRRYCPDDFVTRAQIATLLARALNLDGNT